MTPFRSYKPYTPLAGEPLHPLGQLSGPAGPAITGPEQDAKNTGSFRVRQIFLRSGGLRAGLCIFAALDALVDFLAVNGHVLRRRDTDRSEEHTSELQSLMRISYAVFCL